MDKNYEWIRTKKAWFWQFCRRLSQLCFLKSSLNCSCLTSPHGRQNMCVATIKLDWVWVWVLFLAYLCIQPRKTEVRMKVVWGSFYWYYIFFEFNSKASRILKFPLQRFDTISSVFLVHNANKIMTEKIFLQDNSNFSTSIRALANKLLLLQWKHTKQRVQILLYASSKKTTRNFVLTKE